MYLHRQGYALGDLVLYREKVIEITVVLLAPAVLFIVRIDQFGADANTLATLAYATFEDLSDTLLFGYF